MGTLSIRLTTSWSTRKKNMAPKVQKEFSIELRNSFKALEESEEGNGENGENKSIVERTWGNVTNV